jgi:hypothetical protein
MFQSQEAAREQKTRALITKLNNIIMQRYESYRTRRVPFVFPQPSPSLLPADKAMAQRELARARLDCLHDLMRMEMPDRWTDVSDAPVAPFAHGINTTILPQYVGTIQRPSASAAYYAKFLAVTPTNDYQGAECLYMIVMAALAQEGDSREVFKATDVGDFDNDGYSEFLDGWGRPIRFLRWAPVYDSQLQTIGKLKPSYNSTPGQSVTVKFPAAYFSPNGSYLGNVLVVVESNGQINSSRMGKITGYQHTGPGGDAIFTCETPSMQPQPFGGNPPSTSDTIAILGSDPFDSRGVYPNFTFPETRTPNFNLIPLIYSGGSDRAYGIVADVPLPAKIQYSTVRLYPCYVPTGTPFGLMMGTKDSATGEPPSAWLDNITSHDLNKR